MNDHRLLIVDDDPDIVEFLSYNLKKNGYTVYSAHNGIEALRIAEKIQPTLIILDVMMPDMDGIETCQEIRKLDKCRNSIIAFLSARCEDYSQIAGLNAGADDYIKKPIRINVFLHRINALLNRFSRSGNPSNVISEGGISIDPEKYAVYKDEKTFFLPKKEFEILLLFIKNPKKVLSRDDIFHFVWGDDIIVGDRNIDVHIRRIREKLGIETIKTIKGVGYSFQ